MRAITRKDAAEAIENFVNDTVEPHDWDDFTSGRISDPEVDRIRQECIAVQTRFPARTPGEYCNEEGSRYLLELARQLRSSE